MASCWRSSGTILVAVKTVVATSKVSSRRISELVVEGCRTIQSTNLRCHPERSEGPLQLLSAPERTGTSLLSLTDKAYIANERDTTSANHRAASSASAVATIAAVSALRIVLPSEAATHPVS